MAKRPSSSSINCPIHRKKAAKKQDLVGILIKYPVLLTNWLQFCDDLECPAQDKVKWERGINNRTLQYYDVFSEMLDNWIERNSNKMTVDDLCRVLRGIEYFTIVAEKLESEFNTDEIIQQGENSSSKRKLFARTGKGIKWPLKHGLFVPTRNFTGREEQLEEIKTNFNSKNNLMLITGFGGIGKTELCRKFAYEILTSCVWLHGENLETLRDSVLKLANELGITKEGNQCILEYFKYIASFILENSDRLLLVIDNVDVSYEEVVNVIRITKMVKYEKMLVIVTSRDSNALGGAGITMQLDVLSKLQARDMLQSSMSGLSDSDADKLSELVQYFPLALQQALAYIKQQRKHFRTPNYSVTDYVNEFEVKKSQMLGHKLNDLEDNYSMTTLVTWDMTFRKMSEGAVEILKIIAYLDPDGVELQYFEEVCTQMGVVDFDEGLDMLNSYCLVKIEDLDTILLFHLRGADKKVSVHRLVQEVMRGRVDNNYPKRLFDSVFLVRWKLFGDSISMFSYDVHLKSVYKFAWKCEMRMIYDFNDRLFFLLEFDRIDCAEKVTKIKYPGIQFSLEFGVEKREFLEKVLLWYVVCSDSRTNSEEIAKGEFHIDWKHVKDCYYFYDLETLEGCLQISQKYFDESSKICFALKYQLAWKLFSRRFDRAFLLCEELATFPFEDDDGLANLLYETICKILLDLELEQELTTSQLARLEKIMNKIVKTNPNDSKEWIELEALWCDFKGDYKKALELFTKLVQEEEYYEDKIIELRIKLTDFDSTTVEEFVREFRGVDFDCFTLRVLEKMLEIFELNLGSVHVLTINLKLAMARRLYNGNTTEKRGRCIEFCEQILRSKFDQKYERALIYLCQARGIKYFDKNARDTEYGDDECRKILQNLLETKRRELGKNHRNTKAVLDLLRQWQLETFEEIITNHFENFFT